MWTRAELKEKGKAAFKRNYWKCVLVALILWLVAGGFNSSSGNSNSSLSRHDDQSITEYFEDEFLDSEDYDFDDGDSIIDEDFNIDEDYNQSTVQDTLKDTVQNSFFEKLSPIPLLRLLTKTAFGIIFLIIALIGLLLEIFVFNVLEFGGSRFFLQNAERPAELKEMLYGFDGSRYMNIVKICFFRKLYLFLWTLLLIVPGIIKNYEYYMIPYLLAENPDMTKEEAFAKSREMMDGNKWDTFVLGLSFILWEILSSITFGIVGILFVNPYEKATDAELYRRLKQNSERKETFEF
ncbi:MAG: DUF975 family protein [Lachnospiraceae bacterium]|nr:DUF975 family protein [Lachnospiraceae bacterium]